MIFIFIALFVLMACAVFLFIRLAKQSIVKLTPEEQRKIIEEWSQMLDGEYFL